MELKKSRRNIRRIIIHCTATPEGMDVTVGQIRGWHTGPKPHGNGWKDIGYHYVVYRDGSVHEGRDVDIVGAHTKGYNRDSIGVVYVGGLTADCQVPKDTRTPEQKEALRELVGDLLKLYPGATVHGHNEFAAKACPCFKVRKEFALAVGIVLMLLSSCASGRQAAASQAKEGNVTEADTTMVTDTVYCETSTLISEADSAKMAEYGIAPGGGKKAYLIERNLQRKEVKTIRQVRYRTKVIRYYLRETPKPKAKTEKKSFGQRVKDVAECVICTGACGLMLFIIYPLVDKIANLLIKIRKCQKK